MYHGKWTYWKCGSKPELATSHRFLFNIFSMPAWFKGALCNIIGMFNFCPSIPHEVMKWKCGSSLVHTNTRFFIGLVCVIAFICNKDGILQYHLQFPQEFTITWIRTIRSSGGAFSPTGQLVFHPSSVLVFRVSYRSYPTWKSLTT